MIKKYEKTKETKKNVIKCSFLEIGTNKTMLSDDVLSTGQKRSQMVTNDPK